MPSSARYNILLICSAVTAAGWPVQAHAYALQPCYGTLLYHSLTNPCSLDQLQVEVLRDPSLAGIPLAVQQHQDVIAVNYAARQAGVKKHMAPAQVQPLHRCSSRWRAHSSSLCQLIFMVCVLRQQHKLPAPTT
jgi:hypothetical protein